LNCIRHLLSPIDYRDIERSEVVIPDRVRNPDYICHPVSDEMIVPEVHRLIDS
jgi:hypothetical protein